MFLLDCTRRYEVNYHNAICARKVNYFGGKSVIHCPMGTSAFLLILGTSHDYVPVMREQSSPPASQYYDQDANGNLTEFSGPEFFLNEECIPEYSSDQAHYIETETEPDQEAETQTPTDDSSLSLPVHHENNHTAPHSSTASACEPTHNFFCNLGAHLKIATMPDY